MAAWWGNPRTFNLPILSYRLSTWTLKKKWFPVDLFKIDGLIAFLCQKIEIWLKLKGKIKSFQKLREM